MSLDPLREVGLTLLLKRLGIVLPFDVLNQINYIAAQEENHFLLFF